MIVSAGPTWIQRHLWCRILLPCLLGMAVIAPAQMSSNSASGSDAPVTISGQVLNEVSNLPIARALVQINGRAILTSYNGKFEFAQVSNSTGFVQVSKPGFYASIEPGGSSGVFLQTSHVATPLVLRLYPEAIFTGTVTEPDGDPLDHVVVSARRSMFNSSGHTWIPVAQAQTDSHGRFRLPVPAGDYKLASMYIPQINGTDKAVLPVTLPAKTSLNTSGFFHIRSGEEQQDNLHPVVSHAYAVTATFDSAAERGFPRIIARSSTGSAISLPVHFSRSDEDGAFKLELPSGTYTLIARVRSPDGIVEGETSVTVADHDVSGIVFHLEPVQTLPVELQVDSVATSDNPQPSLMQFGLMLEKSEADPDDFSFPVPLTAQRDGAMSFTASPGSYHLRARNNQGAWYIKSASYGVSDLLQQEFVVAPGAGGIPIRVTVSNQTASLQGTCTLSGVQAACWVYLIPTTSSASTVFTVRSNEQGIYNYTHLPPGSYQAIAFEQMHSVDYGDATVLAPYATHVRAVIVRAGEKPTLDLETVSEAEMAP